MPTKRSRMFRILFLMHALSLSFPLYAKVYRVGVLYWSMNIGGQVAMRKGLEEEAERLNKELKKTGDSIKLLPYVAGDGEAGIENQIKQMNHMIDNENVDLIIIQPTDSAAVSNPLLKANAKKIPVVAYDQYIIRGEIASYVTSNNYQAGYLSGEYIASLYPDDYEIKLILVDYPKVSSPVERVDGFLDAIKKENQKFKLVATFEAIEPTSGKVAATNILKKFPQKNSIDVIFTVNDSGGLPVVDAVARAGRSEIKIATVDGDPESVKNIRNGRNTVIDSAQFCAELGRQSMKRSWEILSKKKYPKKVTIPTFPVTKSTLHMYPGWLGKVPETFEKEWKKGDFWDNKIIQTY